AALPAVAAQHLEHQPRHAVHAGVARRYQRDLAARARSLDRGPRPADLLGHAGADDLLALDQRSHELDVRGVSDDDLGIADRRERSWRGVIAGARSDADDVQDSSRIAHARTSWATGCGARSVSGKAAPRERNGMRATASVMARPAPGSV